ncbi:MAG: hypothetical protein Q9207_001261 [Kuettlingeria erythrocarpa]
MQNLPREKARNIGVANFDVHNLEQLLSDPSTTVVPSVNQIELHPYNPTPTLVSYCNAVGIRCLGYSPLGSKESAVVHEPRVLDVAERNGKTPQQILLMWGLQNGWGVVVGSFNNIHIISNFELDDWSLSEADLQEISNCQTRLRVYSDLENAVASLKNIAGLHSNLNFHCVKGDITCKEDVKASLGAHNIDCVLHFAAFSHVQDSFEDPIGVCQNNVLGTIAVLDAIRDYGMIQRFVHVSTDEVCGQTEGSVVDKSHVLKPQTRILLVRQLQRCWWQRTSQVMGYQPSLFGATMSMGHINTTETAEIIPRLIESAMAGQKLQIQGHGEYSRRYLYAADAADAFDTILHKGCIGSCYNIGSVDEVTNIDVALKILESFGYNTADKLEEYVEWVEDRPFNDSDYRICDDKLRSLGWV